jgi:hypothetical protein
MADDKRYAPPTAQERLHEHGPRVLSDVELLTIHLGPTASSTPTREAAQRLLDAAAALSEIAWASADELQQHPGIGPARAAAVAAAFELGRRGGWSPPKRGERVLDPARVFELMRPLAHAESQEFHTVLLDVRGRLIKTAKIAEGSLLTQCPSWSGWSRGTTSSSLRVGTARSSRQADGDDFASEEAPEGAGDAHHDLRATTVKRAKQRRRHQEKAGRFITAGPRTAMRRVTSPRRPSRP